MNHPSPLFDTDAYKVSHHEQYPPGTTKVVSNFTPRKSRIPGIDHVVFFGLQAFIKDYLRDRWGDFFSPRGLIDIDSYENEVRLVLNNPNYSADHFRKLHKLGYMPIEIRALPEGTKVPIRLPCMTISNTHPDFFWLTNFLETQLSAQVWHPSTSATIAAEYRRIFNIYCEETGGNKDIIPFQGHDFSMRGQTSTASSYASGAAHLLSFFGSDTIPAIWYLRKYYNAKGFVAGSVAATEHAVMQSGGRDERETLLRLITTYPEGILSVVSDTWDFWNMISNIIPSIKNEIMSRNGKYVIRPDSGDPELILCGNPASKDPYEAKGLIQCLWDIFGGTVNNKEFKELDSHIGAIYGDSITLDLQKRILFNLMKQGFASTNIVLGIGSFTYQHVTRDTFGWAIKATYAVINGQGVNLYKQPKTDDGTKNSAKGLVKVVEDTTNEYGITFFDQVTPEDFESDSNLLKLVYKDGVSTLDDSLDSIRNRLK